MADDGVHQTAEGTKLGGRDRALRLCLVLDTPILPRPPTRLPEVPPANRGTPRPPPCTPARQLPIQHRVSGLQQQGL